MWKLTRAILQTPAGSSTSRPPLIFKLHSFLPFSPIPAQTFTQPLAGPKNRLPQNGPTGSGTASSPTGPPPVPHRPRPGRPQPRAGGPAAPLPHKRPRRRPGAWTGNQSRGSAGCGPRPGLSERQGRARRRDSPLSTRPGQRRRLPAAGGRDTPQTPPARPGGTSAAGRISAPSGWPGPAAPLPRAPPRRALRRRGRAHARGRRTAAGRAGLRAGRGRLLRAGSRPRSWGAAASAPALPGSSLRESSGASSAFVAAAPREERPAAACCSPLGPARLTRGPGPEASGPVSGATLGWAARLQDSSRGCFCESRALPLSCVDRWKHSFALTGRSCQIRW